MGRGRGERWPPGRGRGVGWGETKGRWLGREKERGESVTGMGDGGERPRKEREETDNFFFGMTPLDSS